MLSGREQNLPYSLSRWTDVPAAKWDWFQHQLDQGWMVAFDQRSTMPDRWSLDPDETLGLVFWTKDPTNLFNEIRLLNYRVKVHVTVTGWHEVEKGAPGLRAGVEGLVKATQTFGPQNVTWRFSPVPLVPDVAERFDEILVPAAKAGIEKVYLSFLQENDLLPETRYVEERIDILYALTHLAKVRGVQLLLCNEDRSIEGNPSLTSGVCAPPEDFGLPGRNLPPAEGCGCAMMVDPFTINESCTMGCRYCYAADIEGSPKKRNTTSLRVIQ